MGKIWFFGLFLLLVFPIVFAQSDKTEFYKLNEKIDLTAQCLNDGNRCSGSATCNISIIYPNGTSFVSNAAMSPIVGNSYLFNYTLSKSDVVGIYTASIYCIDGSNENNNDFYFYINNSGLEEMGGLYIGFFIILAVVIIAYFYAGFNVDEKKFGVKVILFFSGFLNIVGALIGTIMIQTNWLGLYQVSEILLWLNGLIIFLMASYYVYYMITKHMNDLAEENEDEDV